MRKALEPLAGLCAVIAMTLCGAAHSQVAYPVKTIRFIVVSAPSGTYDTIARAVSSKLSDALGQAVVVDNRAGANGAVGAELTAKSPPDGHTIMLGGIGNLAISPSYNKKLGYDPLKDFAPITAAAVAGQVLVVHPALPVKSVKDLIALARARPGQLIYGSSGVGTGSHLGAALLQSMAKINMLHVPYKGGAAQTLDLVAGQTQLGFASMSATATFVGQGKLRVLAVTTRERSKLYPDLPTISEAGVPGFDAQNWYGFVAPARTPESVIARLNKEIVQILNFPESRERLLKTGIEVTTSTPEAFGAYIKSEYDKWGRLIRELGITE